MKTANKYFVEFESPVGTLIVCSDQKALTHISWSASSQGRHLKKTHRVQSTPVLKNVVRQLQQYFSGQRRSFELPLNPQGTEFQKKAWKALGQIPCGEVWSYKQQAQSIGKPSAARAVGSANRKNPIAIVVPCHRVIGTSRRLTGYNGGLSKKKLLLNLEGHRLNDDRVLI